MDVQDIHGTPRDERFLDTVAFGSMLVFASVMPPLGPDEAEASAMDDAAAADLRGLDECCDHHADWQCCA